MGILVWIMTGIAIWHFAVFVPDRFRGGIVGAFVAAVIGAFTIGMVIHVAGGGDLDHTGITTLLQGAVGAMIGLAASYLWGVRRETVP